MAITSTLSIDGVSGSITSSVYLNGTSLLDTVTYANSSQQISFVTLSSTQLSLYDFLSLLKFYIAFNNTVLTSIFSPNPKVIVPFSQMQITQANDGVSQLTWSSIVANHKLFDFTCNYPLGMITINQRNQSGTLSYAQWLYLINELNYFQTMVLRAYGL